MRCDPLPPPGRVYIQTCFSWLQGRLALCAYARSGDPQAEALEALHEVAALDSMSADQVLLGSNPCFGGVEHHSEGTCSELCFPHEAWKSHTKQMITELVLCSLGAWHGVLGIIARQKD